MIRVVLAEDQAMVLGALAALLSIERDIEVVGQARDGREALAFVLAQGPDVVLTDIEMPGMSGLDLAAGLQRLGSPGRVIVLTTFARPGFLRRLDRDGSSDGPRTPGAEVVGPRPFGAEVAGTLGLSEGTVRNYVSEIIGKLGARNRIEAARIARLKGWL